MGPDLLALSHSEDSSRPGFHTPVVAWRADEILSRHLAHFFDGAHNWLVTLYDIWHEEIPPTTQSNDGYKVGLAVGAELVSNYASTIVGNFNDSAKAKEAAAAQIADGTGVIFALVDAGLDGLMQAVADSGKDVKTSTPSCLVATSSPKSWARPS